MRSIAKTTTISRPVLILLIAAFVLMAMAIFSSQAKASTCPEIPVVSWWNNTTPEKITAYVDTNHDGDWAPYLDRWEQYEEQMRDVMLRGKSALIKSKGVLIKGNELASYIHQINSRIEATRCIADEVIDARLIEELNNMETAAGGNPELDIQLVE
jgi:hypothetical protein